MLKNIRSMTIEEIAKDFEELKFPKFRAKQVYSWVQEKCVESFDEMTNLSKDMREQLAENYSFYNCKINTKLVSKIDDTVKYLFELHDGEFVESVVMKYK